MKIPLSHKAWMIGDTHGGAQKIWCSARVTCPQSLNKLRNLTLLYYFSLKLQTTHSLPCVTFLLQENQALINFWERCLQVTPYTYTVYSIERPIFIEVTLRKLACFSVVVNVFLFMVSRHFDYEDSTTVYFILLIVTL